MVDYLDTFLRPDDSKELRLRLVKLDTRGFAEGESYAVIGLGGGRKEDDRCASPRPHDHGGLDRGPMGARRRRSHGLAAPESSRSAPVGGVWYRGRLHGGRLARGRRSCT